MKVIFKYSAYVSEVFWFKDKVSFNLSFNMVYKLLYGRCNTSYYGEKYYHLHLRVAEHPGISPLIGKNL